MVRITILKQFLIQNINNKPHLPSILFKAYQLPPFSHTFLVRQKDTPAKATQMATISLITAAVKGNEAKTQFVLF